MSNDQDEVLYRETNLAIAAALYTIGYDLLRLENTSKRGQRAFVFSDLPGYQISNYPTASKLAKDYDQHNMPVDAKHYFRAIKDLKDMLYRDMIPGEV